MYEVRLSAFTVTILGRIKLKIRFLNVINITVLVATQTHRGLKASIHFPSETRRFVQYNCTGCRLEYSNFLSGAQISLSLFYVFFTLHPCIIFKNRTNFVHKFS